MIIQKNITNISAIGTDISIPIQSSIKKLIFPLARGNMDFNDINDNCMWCQSKNENIQLQKNKEQFVYNIFCESFDKPISKCCQVQYDCTQNSFQFIGESQQNSICTQGKCSWDYIEDKKPNVTNYFQMYSYCLKVIAREESNNAKNFSFFQGQVSETSVCGNQNKIVLGNGLQNQQFQIGGKQWLDFVVSQKQSNFNESSVTQSSSQQLMTNSSSKSDQQLNIIPDKSEGFLQIQKPITPAESIQTINITQQDLNNNTSDLNTNQTYYNESQAQNLQINQVQPSYQDITLQQNEIIINTNNSIIQSVQVQNNINSMQNQINNIQNYNNNTQNETNNTLNELNYTLNIINNTYITINITVNITNNTQNDTLNTNQNDINNTQNENNNTSNNVNNTQNMMNITVNISNNTQNDTQNTNQNDINNTQNENNNTSNNVNNTQIMMNITVNISNNTQNDINNTNQNDIKFTQNEINNTSNDVNNTQVQNKSHETNNSQQNSLIFIAQDQINIQNITYQQNSSIVDITSQIIPDILNSQIANGNESYKANDFTNKTDSFIIDYNDSSLISIQNNKTIIFQNESVTNNQPYILNSMNQTYIQESSNVSLQIPIQNSINNLQNQDIQSSETPTNSTYLTQEPQNLVQNQQISQDEINQSIQNININSDSDGSQIQSLIAVNNSQVNISSDQSIIYDSLNNNSISLTDNGTISTSQNLSNNTSQIIPLIQEQKSGDSRLLQEINNSQQKQIGGINNCSQISNSPDNSILAGASIIQFSPQSLCKFDLDIASNDIQNNKISQQIKLLQDNNQIQYAIQLSQGNSKSKFYLASKSGQNLIVQITSLTKISIDQVQDLMVLAVLDLSDPSAVQTFMSYGLLSNFEQAIVNNQTSKDIEVIQKKELGFSIGIIIGFVGGAIFAAIITLLLVMTYNRYKKQKINFEKVVPAGDKIQNISSRKKISTFQVGLSKDEDIEQINEDKSQDIVNTLNLKDQQDNYVNFIIKQKSDNQQQNDDTNENQQAFDSNKNLIKDKSATQADQSQIKIANHSQTSNKFLLEQVLEDQQKTGENFFQVNEINGPSVFIQDKSRKKSYHKKALKEMKREKKINVKNSNQADFTEFNYKKEDEIEPETKNQE